MTTERLATAALLALFALSGCAKSTAPAPNKNTNWLEHCETDDECGEALACRCGICTVSCERDATCELDDRRALCWHEGSDELAEQCDAPASMVAICIPPELVPDEDALIDEEATVVIDGLQGPMAVLVDNERVYWLEHGSTDPETLVAREDGELKSMRLSGRDVVTHASGLHGDTELALDATHAYFTHVVGPREDYDVLSRVPLAGGELEHIYETQSGGFLGIAVVGSRVYFLGVSGFALEGIYAAPNDSSLYTDPLLAPVAAEPLMEGMRPPADGLVAIEGDLYWNDGNAIRRIAMAGDGEATDLASSNGVENAGFAGPLVHDGGRLYWLWHDGNGTGGLASVDVAGSEEVERIAGAASFVTGVFFTPSTLAVDATHVYWAQPSFERVAVTIVRTDRATRETELFVTLEDAEQVLLALSDDHVFVASNDINAESLGGYIKRFAK